MASQNAIRFRADYLWNIPDDTLRYEVIEGRLYATPTPFTVHQFAVSGLLTHIGIYVRQQRLGRVYTRLAVVLDDENGVQPDLIYVSREREHLLSKRGLEGAPDLIGEILSPGTRRRDRGVKMRRYAAAGVPHYWIVDPRTLALEAYRLEEGGYNLTGKHGPRTIFRPELFPGLEIPIEDLWTLGGWRTPI